MNLSKLVLNLKELKLKDKPILIGGGAMEYYGLRKSGHDLDIIISKRDKVRLVKEGYKLNLFGGKTEKDIDSTINFKKGKDNIDLVITLNQNGYSYFKNKSKVIKGYPSLLVISLNQLLLTKKLAEKYSNQKKHSRDVKLILNKVKELNQKTIKKNNPKINL